MNNQIITLDSSVISVQNNKLTTNSKDVAKFFNKAHKNILQSIEKLDCSNESLTANFSAVKFQVRGRGFKSYQMTKDGFMFLVMGFTGKKAAAVKEVYINAFNQMALAQSKALLRPNKLHQLLEKGGFNFEQPQLFSMLVSGDCMSPNYQQGDIVVVESNYQPFFDGVYVVRFGDRLKVQRVQLTANSYMFTSDNKNYASIPANVIDDVSIIGRIVWHVKREN